MSKLHKQPGFQNLIDDNFAAAGVEFAMLTSVLVVLTLCTTDIVPVWLAYTHTSNASNIAGDIATSFEAIKKSDMSDVFVAASQSILPFDPSGLSLRISNVFISADGTSRIYWSCASGSLKPFNALDPIKLAYGSNTYSFMPWLSASSGASSTNVSDTSYLYSEVIYTYSSPAKIVFRSPFTLSSSNFYLPRISQYISFPSDVLPGAAGSVPSQAKKTISLSLDNGVFCTYAQ